jgi:methionyl-tRNA synthetase
VLWNAAEAVRLIAVMIGPVMPKSAAEILDRVGAPGSTALDFAVSGDRTLTVRDALWPRYELKETAVSDEPAKSPEPSATPQEQWPLDQRITIEDFLKVDLRVAKVLTAERVPKSKKLMKMTIDVGTEQRQIVAGIAEAYEPEALVGRHVAIVANLKPATLMGIESNGMVLAASPDGGQPLLVSFEAPPAPGTRIK